MRDRARFIAVAALVVLSASAVAPAKAQVGVSIVHDPTSFIEFAKTSKAALDQITNQIEQINQLKGQLSNQALMLQSLKTDITGPIAQITGQATQLLQDAKGLGYSAQTIGEQFSRLYPTSMAGKSLEDTQTALGSWRETNAEALQQALDLQNQIARNQPATAAQVASVVGASQGAPGQTAAIQATNQLLATVSGQLTQLQNLMITQARAEQTLAAQAAASQAAGAADSQRFWSVTAPASRVNNPGSL